MTFTREEWLDQARALLPGCTEERRVELYDDMMKAQAETDTVNTNKNRQNGGSITEWNQ